jgi:hypothetical protein
MHDPREPHLTAAKSILRYLQGTPEFGLLIRRSHVSALTVYIDATRLVAQTHVTPPPAMRSSSVIILFLGPRSARTSSPVPVWRLSTMPLPTVWLRHVGYANYFVSSTALSHRVRWFTTTTSTPCTSSPTPSSISAPSTLRLTFSLCASTLPSVMFEFYMFRLHHSSSTSSPRVFLRRCSPSFGPVSTSTVARVSSAGGVRVVFLAVVHRTHIGPVKACVPYCIWACVPCRVRV